MELLTILEEMSNNIQKTMNPFQKLFLICDSADQFIEVSKDPSMQDEFLQFSILGCLISIEEILDKGRTPSAVSKNASKDDMHLVNKKMDQIRREISQLLRKLAETYGKEKVTDYLQARVRGLSTNWMNAF